MRDRDEVKRIIKNLSKIGVMMNPHPIIGRPKSRQIIDQYLVRNTRSYIEKVCIQINGTYEAGYYDACGVMIRKFIETIIIETFESNNISSKIKNASGDFFYLRDLISAALAEPSWNLSRNTKNSLPKLKDVGDKSAHSRRFSAIKSDIDKIKDDIRNVSQEIIQITNY